MKNSWNFYSPLALLMTMGLAALFIAGCASPATKRARLEEKMGPPQHPLVGRTHFFGQTVGVEVTLGPPLALARPGSRDASAAARGANRPPPPAEGGGGMPPGMGDLPADLRAQLSVQIRGARPEAPRLVLGVVVHNHGKETLQLAVTEAKSILGDFAIRPSQLALAPDQRSAVDPMHSVYPATFDELDVTVTLVCGERRETQVVRLVPLSEPTLHP